MNCLTALLPHRYQKAKQLGYPVHFVDRRRRRFQDQDSILVIDFAHRESISDANEASMCIVVMASDGHTGTLSHLTLPQFDDSYTEGSCRFADALWSYWQRPVPICIAGGWDGMSDEYLARLLSELQQRGFIVTLDPVTCDIGGILIDRRCTLYPNRVEVKRYHYSGPIDRRILRFLTNLDLGA